MSHILFSSFFDVTVDKLEVVKSVTSAYQGTAGLTILTVKN